jgi:AbrB family looped-hinge helix DNA binding protein
MAIMNIKLSQKGWVVIPAALREKYGLKPGSTVQVVDYGGVLALVPTLENPITDGAGLAKGADSLTQAIVDQHHQDRERE